MSLLPKDFTIGANGERNGNRMILPFRFCLFCSCCCCCWSHRSSFRKGMQCCSDEGNGQLSISVLFLCSCSVSPSLSLVLITKSTYRSRNGSNGSTQHPRFSSLPLCKWNINGKLTKMDVQWLLLPSFQFCSCSCS